MEVLKSLERGKPLSELHIKYFEDLRHVEHIGVPNLHQEIDLELDERLIPLDKFLYIPNFIGQLFQFEGTP